jgi:hypothetical protein
VEGFMSAYYGSPEGKEAELDTSRKSAFAPAPVVEPVDDERFLVNLTTPERTWRPECSVCHRARKPKKIIILDTEAAERLALEVS